MKHHSVIDDIHWPASLSKQRFLAEYWQQAPCLIRGAFPAFENPLTPDELAGLALEEEIPSRLIRHPSAHEWTLSHGPFTEETLTSLPTSDWSLMISDVEKHLDGFEGYLEPFRFIPDWRIDDLMISYAPAGASVGAHIDAYDVFLLQASGEREWQIEREPRVDPAFLPNLDIKILQQFEAEQTHVLAPGDMLYLPPGVAHHGISRDNACMTWSIGFRSPALADIVHEIGQQLTEHLTEADRLQDPGLTPQTHSGEITEQAVENLRAVWDAMTQPDTDTFRAIAGKLLTHSAIDALPPAEPVTLTSLAPTTELQRHPHCRLGFIQTQTGCTLFANARAFTVSRQLAEHLCQHRRMTADDLSVTVNAANHQADDAACVQAFLDAGWLEPV